MTQWELLLFFSHEPLGNGQLKREQSRAEERGGEEGRAREKSK